MPAALWSLGVVLSFPQEIGIQTCRLDIPIPREWGGGGGGALGLAYWVEHF